jgi:hypothetical protein
MTTGNSGENGTDDVLEDKGEGRGLTAWKWGTGGGRATERGTKIRVRNYMLVS